MDSLIVIDFEETSSLMGNSLNQGMFLFPVILLVSHLALGMLGGRLLMSCHKETIIIPWKRRLYLSLLLSCWYPFERGLLRERHLSPIEQRV